MVYVYIVSVSVAAVDALRQCGPQLWPHSWLCFHSVEIHVQEQTVQYNSTSIVINNIMLYTAIVANVVYTAIVANVVIVLQSHVMACRLVIGGLEERGVVL